jgi:hypothetical protein
MTNSKKVLILTQIAHYIATLFNKGFALFPVFFWLALSLPGGYAILFISLLFEPFMIASLYLSPRGVLWKNLLRGTKYFYGGLKLLIGLSMFYIGVANFSDGPIRSIVDLIVGVTSVAIFYQVFFSLSERQVSTG